MGASHIIMVSMSVSQNSKTRLMLCIWVLLISVSNIKEIKAKQIQSPHAAKTHPPVEQHSHVSFLGVP